MPKISKKFMAAIIIAVSLAVVYGTKLVIGLSRPTVATGALARVKGDAGAPIRITEFIDFQCPACAQGAKYLKETIALHPEAIRLELKYFPLEMHQHAYVSAQYAQCASRQEKFWPFHDLILARQGNWKQLADAKPAFDQIAREIQLNREALAACLEDEATVVSINKDKAEGQSRGIKSTPTYFVNGNMFVGKQSLEMGVSKLLKDHGF